jgi:VanZ family protein
VKHLPALLTAAAAICWVGLTIVLLLPARGLPEVPTGDKANHVIGFGTLVAITTLAVWAHRPRWHFAGYWVMGVAISYSILMELLQTLPIISRSGEFADVLANGCGCAVGAIVAAGVYSFAFRRGANLGGPA